MTPDPGSEQERREAELRRLLAEAVEPVRPRPGAEARLQAAVRAQGRSRWQRNDRRQRLLGWGATAIGSVAVVVVAVVLVVNGGGGRGGSSNSSAGSAVSAPSAPSAASALSAPADAAGGSRTESGAKGSAPATEIPYDATNGRGTLRFSAQPVPTLSLPSAPGAPSVRLPAVGRGGGILAVTQLPALDGGTVEVAVVRLYADLNAVDVLVSLAGDRLTLLQLKGQTLLLRVDATHGYACTALNGLTIAPDDGPYVVSGSALVKSPFLVKTTARPAAANCPS